MFILSTPHIEYNPPRNDDTADDIRPSGACALMSLNPIPAEAISAAARRPDVLEAMRIFYADADAAIAAKGATCWNRGDCCRFAAFGHRLFVTTLEVAYYLATGDAPPPVTEETCPHAFSGRCHARERRPLGCRIFYCDSNAQSWQGPMTEQNLARLRELHAELDVPYFYAEWLGVLRELNVDATKSAIPKEE